MIDGMPALERHGDADGRAGSGRRPAAACSRPGTVAAGAQPRPALRGAPARPARARRRPARPRAPTCRWRAPSRPSRPSRSRWSGVTWRGGGPRRAGPHPRRRPWSRLARPRGAARRSRRERRDRHRPGLGGARPTPCASTSPAPRPDGLTLVLLDPPARRPTPAAARDHRRSARQDRLKPRLRSRASWGADPSWRDGRPTYNRTIQQVHVHHTVNSNTYAPGDVPGLLRGIYRYHTANLGWSDIGYNFLVDRFGRTWVGRAGGARKAVRGRAHARLQRHLDRRRGHRQLRDRPAPSKKVLGAIARLAAWKLRHLRAQPRRAGPGLVARLGPLRRRAQGHAARDRRAPRHQRDGLPGRPALRPAPRRTPPRGQARAPGSADPGVSPRSTSSGRVDWCP